MKSNQEWNETFVKITNKVLEVLEKRGKEYDNCFQKEELSYFVALISHKLSRVRAQIEGKIAISQDNLIDLIGYAILFLARYVHPHRTEEKEE